MSWWKDIRERRLIQILGAYIAGGFIALEGVDQLVGNGIIEEIFYPIALVLYVAGLPTSLIIGWYHGEKGVQKFTKPELAMLAVIAVVAVGSVVNVVRSYDRPDSAGDIAGGLDPRTLAVLYFEDAGLSGDIQHVADGLTEGLIDQLSTVSGLSVISRNGSALFRDSELARDSVARALGAGTLIEGSVEARGERIIVTTRLLDGASGSELERGTFDLPASELFAVQDSVASDISRRLRQWLGEEVRVQQLRGGTENVAAWALLQRGERERKRAEDSAGEGDFEAAFAAYVRSDSLLRETAGVDTLWAEPLTLLADNDFRRSRLSFALQELGETVSYAEEGLVDAEGAVEIAPNDPKALEARGTIRYWTWLLNVNPEPAARERLLAEARADLERAVQVDPGLAAAHGTLSHLYYNDDVASAVLSARRAYEADAYLSNADVILWRLYNGSYDLGQLPQAERWCSEGAQRYSDDPRFVECRLTVLTTPAVEPDIEEAWSLLAQLEALGAPEYAAISGEILVGGVIARAGLRDSAENVLLGARSRATPEIDPTQDLLSFEAIVRVQIGDEEGAIDLLKRYIAANPEHAFRPGEEMAWFWRPLADHPRFHEVVGR